MMIELADVTDLPVPVRARRKSAKSGSQMAKPALPLVHHGESIDEVNLGQVDIAVGCWVLATLRPGAHGGFFGTAIRVIDEREAETFVRLAHFVFELHRRIPAVDRQAALSKARAGLVSAGDVGGEWQVEVARAIVECTVAYTESAEARADAAVNEAEARAQAIITSAELERKRLEAEWSARSEELQEERLQWESEIRPQLGWVATLRSPVAHRSPPTPKLDFNAAVSAIRPRAGSELLARAFTGATWVALLHGRLVLSDGPVGAGKTSTIEATEPTWGALVDVIPVRPAWLEPADLLGYFDPIARVFRPGPMAEALARGAIEPDRPHFVVLDEVNLARIENYAADLLSRLERRRDGYLDVWSSEAGKALHGEREALLTGAGGDAGAQRLRELEFLQRHPPKRPVPENLVLFGTLNTDPTTYDLSPKVVDRSFVLSYPDPDLTALHSASDEVAPMTVRALQNSRSSSDVGAATWRQVLDIISVETMARIGIGFSHRVRADIELLGSVLERAGAPSEAAVDVALFTRVLPRVTFLAGKGDEAQRALRGLLSVIDKRAGFQGDRAWVNLRDRLLSQVEAADGGLVRFFRTPHA